MPVLAVMKVSLKPHGSNMKYVTLDMAKRHLNIEPSYTDEDPYIETLITVAEEKTAKELCVSVDDLAIIDGGKTIPTPLVQAMMLCLGAYYANRENLASANLKEIPQGARYLVELYRDYSK